MRRLFLIPTITLLVIASSVFAQGEAIRNAVTNTQAAVNEMLEQGDEIVMVDGLIVNEVFSVNRGWTVAENPLGAVHVANGQYELTASRFRDQWGQNVMLHSDVVIQVDAEIIGEDNGVGYGLMCRADPANTRYGYHFWVRGRGEGAISRITRNGTQLLSQWRFSQHINRGLKTSNMLTVVCVDDYLALYINDVLHAEVRDDTFTQGVTGVSTAASGRRSGIEANFDNLRIWSVAYDESNTADDRPTSVRNLVTDADALLPPLNRILEQGEETINIVGIADIYTFDIDDDDWTIAEFPAGEIIIEDGAYNIRHDSSQQDFSLIIGNNTILHRDVVIEVTIENLTNNTDANAGLACRSDLNSDFISGYIFWIGSDGYYTILHGDNDGVEVMVDFTYSDAINIGKATNEVMIVCSESYLALYINGELVQEDRDRRLTSGVAMLGATYLNEFGSYDIAFDNVRIWTVEPE